MNKVSKSKLLALLCTILSGVAFASDVHLLDINVYSWSLLQPGHQGGKNFVKHIIANKYDFVTTQEADAASLLDPSFGNLGSEYQLVGGTNQDANIYYNDTIWQLDKMEVFNTTPDNLINGNKGRRIALLGKFHNKQDSNKVITVATTHLCVSWSSSRGCLGDTQANAHIKDVQNITTEINQFSGISPVIFSGDFNNLEDIVNQTRDIKNKVSENSFTYINYGGNPSPVWADNNPIDFTFYKNLTQDGYAKGYMKNAPQPDGGINLSDHDGIDVSFNL